MSDGKNIREFYFTTTHLLSRAVASAFISAPQCSQGTTRFPLESRKMGGANRCGLPLLFLFEHHRRCRHNTVHYGWAAGTVIDTGVITVVAESLRQ